MAKGRRHMYDLMIKDKKRGTIYKRDFFSNVQMPDEETVKIVFSHKAAEALTSDMQTFANFMTQSILGGLLNDRQ